MGDSLIYGELPYKQTCVTPRALKGKSTQGANLITRALVFTILVIAVLSLMAAAPTFAR